jgi:hypothetical protein
VDNERIFGRSFEHEFGGEITNCHGSVLLFVRYATTPAPIPKVKKMPPNPVGVERVMIAAARMSKADMREKM